MKYWALLLLFIMSSVFAQGTAPVAEDLRPSPFKSDQQKVIPLSYSDAEGDLADSCDISALNGVAVIEPCVCRDGACQVVISGTSSGDANFTYTVTANNQVSNAALVTLKIHPSVNFWREVLGLKGLLILIGSITFLYSYRNSIKIFNWVDEQTYGTRDYILRKFEIMFIEVDPNKITWALLTISFGFGIITFCILALFGKLFLGTVLGIFVTIVGWKAPRPVVDFFENRRKKKFQIQMVDALNLMANGLRAGLSLPQAIGMVVDELPAPISQEFNLVLQQAKIGVPLDEALENFKKRIYTEDNEMFVTSVNILRETGANLAETFDTIVAVIRERVRLQLKIDTYVASGKIQAYIIGAMPFLMILMFGSGDAEYFPLLFGTVLGVIALIVICGMVALGMWVIFKIIDIKV